MKRIALALVALIFLLGLTAFLQENTDIDFYNNNIDKKEGLEEFKTFDSESDFSSYLESYSDTTSDYSTRPTGLQRESLDVEAESDLKSSDDSVSRVSQTNVQVQGIDEPDIVKTDGETIFFSPERYTNRKTKVLNAFPPENLSSNSEIDEKGKMLLKDDFLVVFSRDSLHGYDVSNPESPEEKWDVSLNGSVAGARLYKGDIYIVLEEDIDYNNPCPIRPLKSGSEKLEVACSDIYHPVRPARTDVTYTAVSLDFESGEIMDDVSFVGSSRDSTVYMSEGSIYSTYTHRERREIVMMDFITEQGSDIFPQNVVNRIEKLKDYNISDRAKSVELQSILEEYGRSLSKDERMKMENEFENQFGNYSKENKRDLETTGIVKIGIEGGDLEVEDTGSVPGSPLNQFSMNEHDGNFRIATNIDFYRSGSENDVYVLDENLDVTGSVEGLGKTERIYSVRFMGERGYVVTYKKIDPFYVLDLSNPEDPEMKGELKLPGYSSYLHPLEGERILGIGEEDRKVKAAIFDVSNPENPELEDSYKLNEYYSDVSQSHHAFLLDKKHEVFFLPGSQGGYIFSYQDGLDLEKTVSIQNAKRAIYINDYMYILAESGVSVLDEEDWDKVKEMEFEEEERPIPTPTREEQESTK